MYFTWAEMESWSSVGREDEVEARPGPDTRDILMVLFLPLYNPSERWRVGRRDRACLEVENPHQIVSQSECLSASPIFTSLVPRGFRNLEYILYFQKQKTRGKSKSKTLSRSRCEQSKFQFI